MSNTTRFDVQKLADAISEKSGEAQAAGISTEETLAALALMGVAGTEAELRQHLAWLNHRPGSGLRA